MIDEWNGMEWIRMYGGCTSNSFFFFVGCRCGWVFFAGGRVTKNQKDQIEKKNQPEAKIFLSFGPGTTRIWIMKIAIIDPKTDYLDFCFVLRGWGRGKQNFLPSRTNNRRDQKNAIV